MKHSKGKLEFLKFRPDHFASKWKHLGFAVVLRGINDTHFACLLESC